MKDRVVLIGNTTRVAVLLLGLVAGLFCGWACLDQEKLYAAVGLMGFFIILAPFLQLKEYDLFCPWSFVILAFGLLSTPQAVCMSFSFPDAESIERMMLLGRGPSDFVYPSGLFLLSLLCLTIGYFGFPSKSEKSLGINREINYRNATVVLSATICVSILATFLFVRATGGIESGRVSDKRTNIETLDVAGDSGTKQYGYLRQTSKIGSAVFLVLYAILLTKSEPMTAFQKLLLFLVFVAACALPFYASSRSQVCWIILNGLGMNYYLGGRGFVTKCVIVVAIGLTLFVTMSFLRNKDTDDAIEVASVATSFEKLVLNRNGPGLSKTAHIINNIPDPLGYQYGMTFAEWLIAPVPRALFPGKPMIGTGPIIGTTIYKTKLSGVPPGFIAELYWNFYIPGIVFGMLILGMALQRVYNLFCNLEMSPAIVVPIYLFAVMPIAFTVLGNSLGFGTMMRFVDFVTISGIVLFCTSMSTPSTSPRA